MNLTKRNKKSWFTLVEMLIVIVIIWILAAALIPKLQSARWKANDVARKANLNQVATALMSYNIDKWVFPSTWWWLSAIENELIYAGMTSIPRDPDLNKQFGWIWTWTCWPTTTTLWPKWDFMYTPAKKWSILNSSYIIMAWIETEWWANYMRDWTSTHPTLCPTSLDVNDVNKTYRCEPNCTKSWDNLRYIVTY